MARKPRIHYPGALYHVILRGNAGQDVFFEDDDRYRFYLLLQEGTERFHCRIHAFCLMTNHIHLVIQVADTPLSRIMQNLSFRYTGWINRRHNRAGHLFQGRYKAVLVDGNSHLLELVRYVQLNPVRAGIEFDPDEYPWTSHRAYCGNEVLPWLTTMPLLSMFSPTREPAVRAYRAFIDQGLFQRRRPEFHGEGLADSRVLGDDDFLEKSLGADKSPFDCIPIGEIVTAVCRQYSLTEGELARPGKERSGARARAMAAWIVQDIPSVTLRELAEKTGRDISSLSAAALRLRKSSVAAPELLREKGEVLDQITRSKA
jgi:REP element-mobilizing transposase RayT